MDPKASGLSKLLPKRLSEDESNAVANGQTLHKRILL